MNPLISVLNNVKEARNELVSALNSKGVTIGVNATINQCANAIKQINVGEVTPSDINDVAVYMCTSATNPLGVKLYSPIYGGDYYECEGVDGRPAYTNGTYFILPDTNHVVIEPAGSWYLYSQKVFNDDYKLSSAFSLKTEVGTLLNGEKFGVTPLVNSSGTWSGLEVALNESNYYEPVSNEETVLTFTNVVPQAGQMYTCDALMHVDQIWNYDYKRDVKILFDSTTNQMNHGYGECWGVGEPDEDGWYHFGVDSGASISGENYDYGGNTFTSAFNNFTLSFKFKYNSEEMSDDINGGVLFRLWGSDGWWHTDMLLQLSIDRDGNLGMASHSVTTKGDTSINYRLLPNTEYSIIITCDNVSLKLIINNVLVDEFYSSRISVPVSVLLIHDDWGNTHAPFYYKEVSLWGRILEEVTSSLVNESMVRSNVVVSNGTNLYTKNDVVDGLTISGGQTFIYAGGSASNVSIYPALLTVMESGSVNNVNIYSAGRLVVSNGGTAESINVLSGGFATFDESVESVTIDSQAKINGFWIQEQIQNTNIPEIKNDVILSNTSMIISNHGSMRFAIEPETGKSNTVLIESGGTAYIGSINHSTEITNYGTIIGSNAQIRSYDNDEIDEREITRVRSGSIINNYGIVSGVRVTLPYGVSENYQPQGSMTVHSGGTGLFNYIEGCTTISSGGIEINPDVNAHDLDWMQTELLVVLSGGTVSNPHVHGWNTGITINSGGICEGGLFEDLGCVYVYGYITNASVGSGGTMHIGNTNEMIGSGENLIISSGANVIVYSGSILNGVTISSGGVLHVSSGGTALNVTQLDGAYSYVDDGGTIINAEL